MTRAFPWASARWLRALFPVAMVFIAASASRELQTDLWHHLARGREMLLTHQLVNRDLFTFTVGGEPLRDVNWLWQLAFYGLHQLGGLALLQTVNAALMALCIGLLVRLAWRRSGSLAAAALGSGAAVLGLWQLILVRPQTVSLVLFVVLVDVLERARANPRWLALPPVLVALWANLHGAFPMGVAITGLYLLGDVVERRTLRWPVAVAGAATIAAMLINPYGPAVFYYVTQTAGRASSRRIEEWLPPSFSGLPGLTLLGLSAVMLFLILRSPRRMTWPERLMLAVLTPLAFSSVRMLAWWLLAVVPVLAAHLAALRPELADAPGDERPAFGPALMCLVMAGLAVVTTPWFDRINPVMRVPGRAHRTEQDLEQVARHLRSPPAADGASEPRRLFARLEWGEYFSFALSPGWKVFMDGRIEIIPADVFTEYETVTAGRPGWSAILQRYRVGCLVLDRSGLNRALIAEVQRDPAWRETLRAGDAVVFERHPPHSGP
jgi:hypothetical protein